jgi:hypothetical protein
MKRLKVLCDPVSKLARGGGKLRRAIWAHAGTGPTLAEFLAFCRKPEFKGVRWTKGGASSWDLDEMQKRGAIELVEA